VRSDFSAARFHLDRAYLYLGGTDEMSQQARLAINLLIEAVSTCEFAAATSSILALREQRKSSPHGTG